MFETIDYTVQDIQGDYAILVNANGETKPVAMFFLPLETDVGSHIRYENMEYSIA